jgi:hypothetical protein
MTRKEFEDYLLHLSGESYTALIAERIGRLTGAQKNIALDRESKREVRFQLINKLADPNLFEEVLEELRKLDGDACEHGRSYVKHCYACGEIDHLMFPELFDKNGDSIEDE